MAVFKINKTKDYTVMSNHHLKEKEMSLKAKGLLSIMLSLPENWDYSISGIVAICKENESAINSTLKELKEFGYLRVDKFMPNQTKSGRIEYVYNIYEIPKQNQCAEKQEQEKQGLENLCLEIQGVENQGQYNINNKSTNKLNTDKLNNNNIKENIIKEIIEYLNLQIGTKYSYKNKKTQSLINARFKENKEYTVDDFFLVIDKKVKEWKGTEMEKYLRPETLFGTKFENYLNQNESVSKQSGHKEDMFEQLDRVFREVENERIN